MYTYRYSREPTTTVSWVCPICLKKTTIIHEDQAIPRRYINTNELCCSPEHTKEYEKRIRRAIAWARDEKLSKLNVSRRHYNSVGVRGVSKYSNLAELLSNLGEYFPFNPVKEK